MTDSPRRYGPVFWAGLAIGWAVIAFGLWGVLARAGSTKPPNFALFLLGAVVVHDLVLVPAVLAIGVWIRGRVRPPFRAYLQGALIATGALVLFSYPAVRGFGVQADNASLLPGDYAAGLLVSLAAVWVAGATLLAWRLRRRARGRGRP